MFKLSYSPSSEHMGVSRKDLFRATHKLVPGIFPIPNPTAFFFPQLVFSHTFTSSCPLLPPNCALCWLVLASLKSLLLSNVVDSGNATCGALWTCWKLSLGATRCVSCSTFLPP